MSCHCCSTIFWTAEYNSPHTFCLADYSVLFCDLCSNVSQRAPPTTNNAPHPLEATLRNVTLPFLIPVRKLVSYGSQHHLLLFIAPCSLRHVEQCSFPYICFTVTSTGLMDEGILTDVSRLVYMDHLWRWYVGIPALGDSHHLSFVNGKPLTGQ